MRIEILGCGTSTGVPVPACGCSVCRSTDPRNQRTRTSAAISNDLGKTILIDSSPDLRTQVLRSDIRRVDGVIYTHAHADHILGIEDLKGFNFAQGSSIPLYGVSTTLKDIHSVFRYIFDPDPNYEGGGLAQLTLETVTYLQPFSVAGITITPFPLHHGSQRVTGFKIGNMAYATDCNLVPDESCALLQGVKLLFLDGLRYEPPHRTHFTIPQAIATAQRLGVEQTYLLHMTHTVDYATVSAQLPEGIALAYDGLTVDFE